MKKALVIGASSGIGKELALILSKEGYEVGLMARRVEELQKLQKEIPSKTYISYVDISQIPETIDRVNQLTQKMGGLDLIIINSGVGFLNENLDWELEKQTIDVNVYGFTALAGWSYNYFAKQGYGHIVGISSIAAFRGNPIATAYNASKAFMSNYLEGLCVKAYMQKKKILVTDIKPGYVDTPMAKGGKFFWMSTPQKAAAQIYEAIRRGKRVAYITRRWRLIAWVLKIIPFWMYKRTV